MTVNYAYYIYKGSKTITTVKDRAEIIMRLFIAINLRDNLKNALTEMQDELRSRHVSGNYSPTENLHITLAFIGEYPDPDAVMDALETIDFKPFDITLDGFGNFGDLFWAGLASSEALSSLAKKIRHALADAGIPFDRKKFTPHITLVRKAKYNKFPKLKTKQTSMKVTGVSLMRSDFGKSGVRYAEVGTF